MEHKIKIKNIEYVTHNVLRISTDKPEDYTFKPGQATEMSIDKDNWREEKRPFTFTSLPDENELEFTIKVYPSHDGMTDQLRHVEVGDHLLIGDVWGAINYQGTGTFIAGGAGVTPFIAILKDLQRKDELKGNRLFFANDKSKDIIYLKNLETWLKNDLYLILSEEKESPYAYGQIDKAYLEKHNLEINRPVYLCGPPPMTDAISAQLYAMGLPKSHLITEE